MKKIAITVAATGSLAGVWAESMTFGVEIPPIASLTVRDGMIKDATTMFATAVPTAVTAIEVGGFTVVTNMPKWNIFFGFSNGGTLKNQNGRQITNNEGSTLVLGSPTIIPVTGGTNAALAATDPVVWLTANADEVNSQDNGDDDIIVGALATNAPGINNQTYNTLTAAMEDAGLTTITAAPGAADFGTDPWLASTDLSVATFAVKTALYGGATATSIASVAGTYTETMYVTLVTTY